LIIELFLHLFVFSLEVISSAAMKFPKIHNPLFIAVVATLGGMLFGFDIPSMSATILTDQSRNFFNNPSGVRQGAIGSSLAAGSVFGSAIAGPFSDWIGRRNSISYSCFFWITGTVLQTATNGFGMLVTGRILNGMYWLVGDMLVVMLTRDVADHVKVSLSALRAVRFLCIWLRLLVKRSVARSLSSNNWPLRLEFWSCVS
jgi:MFS family permease